MQEKMSLSYHEKVLAYMFGIISKHILEIDYSDHKIFDFVKSMEKAKSENVYWDVSNSRKKSINENQVTLTSIEMLLAGIIGLFRRISSIKRNCKSKYDPKEKNWATEIEAVMAEMAFAKYADLYWDASVCRFRGQGADVGPYQVRHAKEEYKNLIIRAKDSDEDPFVLVLGVAPTYRIIGWLEQAKDGKIEHFLKSPHGIPPAFFVPKENLKPINTLLEREKCKKTK